MQRATLDVSRGEGLTQLIGGTCHQVAGVREKSVMSHNIYCDLMYNHSLIPNNNVIIIIHLVMHW